ncbi:unnamed protein product, partial [Hapterophycus canaliculatus]
MKHALSIGLVAGTLAIAAPAAAQDDSELSEGLGLLGEGTRLILEGLMEEMQPIIDEARPYFEDEVLP